MNETRKKLLDSKWISLNNTVNAIRNTIKGIDPEFIDLDIMSAINLANEATHEVSKLLTIAEAKQRIEYNNISNRNLQNMIDKLQEGATA